MEYAYKPTYMSEFRTLAMDEFHKYREKMVGHETVCPMNGNVFNEILYTVEKKLGPPKEG